MPYQVWSVAFSPDGRQLVTGSGYDKTSTPQNLIQVWNLDTRTPDREAMQGPTDTTVFIVAFDSTGQEVISGSSDGTVRVWDMDDCKEVPKPLFMDQNPVYSLPVAHNDRWIAARGAGGVVRVWDMENKRPEDPLEDHQDWIHSVAISSDDTLIASGSADGKPETVARPDDCGRGDLQQAHHQRAPT